MPLSFKQLLQSMWLTWASFPFLIAGIEGFLPWRRLRPIHGLNPGIFNSSSCSGVCKEAIIQTRRKAGLLVRRRKQTVSSSNLQRFCVQILCCGLVVLRKLDLFADPARSVWSQPHGTSSSVLQIFLHISATKEMRLPHILGKPSIFLLPIIPKIWSSKDLPCCSPNIGSGQGSRLSATKTRTLTGQERSKRIKTGLVRTKRRSMGSCRA